MKGKAQRHCQGDTCEEEREQLFGKGPRQWTHKENHRNVACTWFHVSIHEIKHGFTLEYKSLVWLDLICHEEQHVTRHTTLTARCEVAALPCERQVPFLRKRCNAKLAR